MVTVREAGRQALHSAVFSAVGPAQPAGAAPEH